MLQNKEEPIKQIKNRRNKLEKVSKKLKNKFIGIDNVIDSVINNIKVWYIMPETLTRPVIVNLWGLTGVGKTDLVRTLAKELNFLDQFLEIQLNRNSNGGYGYPKFIQSVMNNSSLETNKPGILLLDEMQKFRTVDNNNTEIENNIFQDMWTLLSDGKFPKTCDIQETLIDLFYGGKYELERSDEDEPNSSDNESPTTVKTKKNKKTYHQSQYAASRLKNVLKSKESIVDIMKWNDDKKFEMIYKALSSQKSLDGDSYSKLLIFISGNLDEAYQIAGRADDADIDADIFHEYTSDINFVNIKTALLKRFKPEQISRFGNNHIVYPSLSKENYKKIIKKRIKELTQQIKIKYKINIKIDKTIYDAIYRNGVFPAQGVRPVLSTISSFLENSFPFFLLYSIENNKNEIFLKYDNYTKEIVATINNKLQKYFIEGSIDKIKKKYNHNSRILTSVHEAGHSIIYALLFQLVPTQILSNTSLSDSNGYIGMHKFNGSKTSLLNKISVFLAGQSAEELIFGEENKTNGSETDIAKATGIASDYVISYGMDKLIGNIMNPYYYIGHNRLFNIYEANKITETILNDCKKKSTNLLQQNMTFLKETTDKLIENGEIKSLEFKKIAKNHNLAINIKDVKGKICEGYAEKYEKFNFSL